MPASHLPIYLDYNATTPLHDAAMAAMQSVMGAPANPSSVHHHGRQARFEMEKARRQLASLLDCQSAELVFTSGATESNNMALAGFEKVITTTIEHDAVRQARPDAHFIEVDENGLVKLDMLRSALEGLADDMRAKTLVSVMAANNETGVIQPLSEIAAITKEAGVFFHSDMAQLPGKVPVNIETSLSALAADGLDFASFSAHKMGGPAGVGALWVRAGRRVPAMLHGGGQEQGWRAGTENLIGIVGFGAAAEATEKRQAQTESWQSWRDEVCAHIRNSCPSVICFSEAVPRLSNTLCLGFPGWSATSAVMALDLAGFSVSAGSACSSGKVKSSHVIEAMGYHDLAASCLRISFGWDSQRDELMMLADQLIDLYKRQA